MFRRLNASTPAARKLKNASVIAGRVARRLARRERQGALDAKCPLFGTLYGKRSAADIAARRRERRLNRVRTRAAVSRAMVRSMLSQKGRDISGIVKRMLFQRKSG